MTAKALRRRVRQAAAAINHLEGHALTARLTDGCAVSLSAAAGLRRPHADRAGARRRRLRALGDDDRRRARRGLRQDGEAARPALSRRPNVEKAAATGDANRFDFPRPLKGEKRPDFSFSGLKTAVRQAATAIAPLTDQDVADICASFQRRSPKRWRPRGRSLDRFRATFPDHNRRRWSWPAASPPTRRSGALEGLATANGFASSRRRWRCAPTMPR
jgi:N6-L-threonylcarbamoyladenine synthase